MGVYIKGMEMPKSCYACMFFGQTDYWNKEDEADILSHCKRTGEKTWESVNGYLPNCPLVPIPSHGRCIDADALIEDLERQCKEVFRIDAVSPDDYWITRNEAYNEALWKSWVDSFGDYLKTRPTIIEAEEET